MSYTIDKRAASEFDETVESVTEALSTEGFGVLCDIDVQSTFAEKLGLEEYRRYRILGACNPTLAHDALEEELALGALLPCNVVVYEADDGTVTVSAVDPEVLLGVVEHPALDDIAEDVRERFERVLDRLPDADDV